MADRPHSVPFIMPKAGEDNGQFEVRTEALEILAKIKTPVAPVAIVGKYRTGKSFLLNKLLNRQGGFEVGPTIEACTKGIWLWSEPNYIMLPDNTTVAVLYFDTEGIGAAGATAEHDARIFSLATLLCSLLVYNSVGSIDEEAVQSLSFVANLTKHIQLKSGAAGAEAAVAEGADLEDEASDDSEEESHPSPAAGHRRAPKKDSDESHGEEEEEEHDDISAMLGVSPSKPKKPTPTSTALAKPGQKITPTSSKSRSSVSQVMGFFRSGSASRSSAAVARDSDEDERVDYIDDLKRSQRKKRAAAKRALANRLREEARRAAGLRREKALDGGKDSVGMATDDSEVSLFFPSFLWVLRDFSLELVDEEGGALTPREYLETCLAQQEGFSTDAQARNRVRRVLTSFFKDRECATLVRPLEDETRLQVIDTLPESALRVEFRKQIAELKVKLIEELIRPKTMQGQYVTGRMLGGLAQAYIGAINAAAVPSIGNAWDGVTRVECKDALDGALHMYESNMERDAPRTSLPFDEIQLLQTHEKNRIAALDEYESKAVGPAAERYRQELKGRVAELWKVLSTANTTASETTCIRLITRLWHAQIEPKLLLTSESASGAFSKASAAATVKSPSTAPVYDVYHNYEAFKVDIDKLKEDYHKEARGPAAHKTLANFLVDVLPTVVRAINAARAAESDKRVADIEHALTASKRELEAAVARTQVLESQCNDLRNDRKTNAVERARAEQEVKFLREERTSVDARIKEIEMERDELAAKLKQERFAHAQTRVALRTGAASDKKLASSEENGERWASPTKANGSRQTRPSVDFSAIMGHTPSKSDLGRGRDGRPTSPSTRITMKPKGAEEIAMPGGNIQFPSAPPPSGGACAPNCTIQ